MPFRPEPLRPHGTPARTGILLLNLGSPDAPTTSAVRRYLRQFLSDPRVIEIPRAIWLAILYGVILPIRSSRSAARYAKVWTADGSPLKVWTGKQAKLLRGALGKDGIDVTVVYAMRYGEPNIASALDQMKAQGCERILVLPLYPQYSATTTASGFDAVNAWCATVRNVPELRFVKHFHDDAGYIDALARSIVAFRERNVLAFEQRTRLLMSFHGVPKRTLMLGDPYHCECRKTARLVAERLQLAESEWLVTFQSRFGKAEWLKPYTSVTLAELGRDGARVDICCPGFPADCLETLEEIAIEGKQIFTEAGGRDYRYVPCLNDDPAWIAALAAIARRHLAEWIPAPEGADALRQSKERARRAGALR